ncbi:MAG: site-specific integrase [Bryobacterales bacterium]|nr:tyrosine-type recombinase/integrase [Bryobacteraceae bacterium]MDW8353789.1 site-specific integrase [Bryobacterales bacterium]
MPIYKRGNTWWYEFVFQGRRVRRSTHQRNKHVALMMMNAHRTALAKGQVGLEDKPAPPTVAEFADEFRQAIAAECTRPRTIEFYCQKLARLLDFAPLAKARLDQVDEALISAYTEHRRKSISRRKQFLAPASINRELATLRRMLRLAWRWRLIDRPPDIRLLGGEEPREYVLPRETERLYFEMAPPDLRDVAILMLDCGLRMREALLLEWPDVHFEPAEGAVLGWLRIRARTSKGERTRTVPLTQRAAAMLRARGSKRAGLVFRRPDGRPLSQTQLNHQHARIRALLKLPGEFVLHSLRHTYGTRLGEAGADAFSIMRLMGHSSVVTSQRYVHPTPEALEAAVRRMEARSQRVPTIFTTVPSDQEGDREISP